MSQLSHCFLSSAHWDFFLNFVKSNQIWIVITLQLTWYQTEYSSVPYQSEKCDYNYSLIWLNKIQKKMICVYYARMECSDQAYIRPRDWRVITGPIKGLSETRRILRYYGTEGLRGSHNSGRQRLGWAVNKIALYAVHTHTLRMCIHSDSCQTYVSYLTFFYTFTITLFFKSFFHFSTHLL